MTDDRIALSEVEQYLEQCASSIDMFGHRMKGAESFSYFKKWSDNIRTIRNEISDYIENNFDPKLPISPED